MTYDDLGRKLTESDFKGNTTSYTYDNAGRLLTMTTPLTETKNSVTRYYYDANGNIVKQEQSTEAEDSDEAVCTVAVVATAGGAAAGIAAVAAVANGTAAATAASTVAAGAFIGSATVYGTAALYAAGNSSLESPEAFAEDFAAQGNWGTVAGTAGGAVIGGACGYDLSRQRSPSYVESTNSIDKRYTAADDGPLPPKHANNFEGGSYTQITLKEDATFYRGYGGSAGKVGSYMTRVPQNGGMQSQIDLALNPDWGNSAQYVTKVVVSRGTVIYEGTAASQTINGGAGMLLGGGNQVYIPNVEASWFIN